MLLQIIQIDSIDIRLLYANFTCVLLYWRILWHSGFIMDDCQSYILESTKGIEMKLGFIDRLQ